MTMYSKETVTGTNKDLKVTLEWHINHIEKFLPLVRENQTTFPVLLEELGKDSRIVKNALNRRNSYLWDVLYSLNTVMVLFANSEFYSTLSKYTIAGYNRTISDAKAVLSLFPDYNGQAW